jgi:hypothetical protein
MARKFLTSLDLNQNELIKAVVQNSSSDPGSGRAGQIYYNTADDVLKIYSGTASAWVAVGSEEYIGDAVADLLDAGDGIYLNYNDPSDSLTITNTGVLSLTGTEDEISVSASAGNITLSLPESITVDVTGDLTGNADTATALETARTISLGGTLSGSASFDGTSNITITAGDLDGNASTATALETARTISLGGDLSGSASFDGTNDITISATIQADSITLGTDTTGDYVAGVSASAGIDVAGSGGEGSSLTITNTGVLSVAGTENEITVSASAGNVTIGLPDNVTVGGNLIVTGDLTVSGSTTYLNTATLEIEDNLIVLNSNVTGTPTLDAGIEVGRGDEPNSSFYWDESEGKWTASSGSAAIAVSLEGHTHSSSNITDFSEAVEDAVDSLVTDTDTVGFVYTDNGASAGTLAANVLLAGAASATFLTTTGGLSVDKATLETALIADSFTKKYSVTIGDGSNTAYAITHDLGTRDCLVEVYDISTYETVEVDVVRTNTTTVTVTFAEPPANNTYRVVVVG